MSDPLSVAGSIAGILSLSVGVFHKLVRFGKEVKGAQSKVEQLASECRNLSGVLQNLTLLASSLDSELTGPTNNKAHYLHDCRNTLFKLESHLKKARNDFDGESRIKATVRRLKWPFSTPETTDLINDIRRHRETLEFALSADTLTALLDCLKRQDALRSGVDELRDTIERRFQIETRVELVKKREEVIKFFMGSVNPQASLQDCLELRSPMTGLWLTESDPTFVQWRHEPGSKLWLSGIPGAGKTVLCGAVIEEILQDSSNTVAVSFFFCAYKSADTQDPVKLLSAIATQLALQSSEAFGKLEDYYNKLNPRDHLQSQPRLPKLRKLIHNMTTCFGRVYVVIDGIDECGQNVSKIAQAAKDLSTDSLNLNIAIFSRDEHEIREELEDGFEHVEIAAHTEDLDIYVQAEMSTRKRLLHLSLRNPGLHEEIRSTLIKGAHGMFRWVACQLDYLCELSKDKARRKALQSLPPSLKETYHRILIDRLRAGPEVAGIVRKVLHWTVPIAHAVEWEFREASQSSALREAVSLTDEDAIEPEDLIDEDAITRHCSSLIRKRDDVFEFAHFTVREFLDTIDAESDIGYFQWSPDDAKTSLFNFSLRYITFPQFSLPLRSLRSSTWKDRNNQRRIDHPFYEFAAFHVILWHGYVPSVRRFSEAEEYMQKLLDPLKTGNFLAWMEHLLFSYESPDRLQSVVEFLLDPGLTTLHIAAALALPRICESLLSKNIDVYSETQSGPPLHFAVLGCGALGLRKNGARIMFHERPPEAVAQTVELLLRWGASTKATPHVPSALSQALYTNQTSSFVPLLKASVPNRLDVAALEQALTIQWTLWSETIEEILLEREQFNQSAGMIEFLSVAQSVRDQEMHREADDANTSVSVAIEDCTDEPPNSVRRLYQDLDEELRANVLNGSIFRIRNLPQRISAYGHNIDDGLPSCSTCTPLTKAILNNKGSLLGAIIQRTSEAPRTCYIHTARHEQGLVQLATRFLQEPRYLCAVLKFAFDHGLSWSGFDLSPLHIALFRKRTGDLKILLAHASKTISEPAGSSHHEQTREQNELEYMRTLSAVYPGDSREGLTGQQQKSLSLILDQLSEPIYDENMDLTHPVMEVSATPLHYAAAIGLCKGVKLLLEWGADKNCPDEHGRTALIWASKGGYFDIARILVDAGANAAIYDQFARNAISYAIEFGSVEIIEILTMQGGQALYGGIFDTPDLLAYSPNVKTFQNLVDRGLDPHVTDPSERSGLSCFLERTRCWPYLLMSCLWSSATNLEITDMIDTATINNDDMTRKLCKARSASCYLDLNRCFEGEGRSPLCVAALIDSTRMVKTLLDFGANINFDGSPYGSALLAACYHGRHEIVKLLVREGAAMQYISPAGEYRNAFEAAQAHPNIVRWFLVERFLEQRRLTSESAGQDVPLKCWSGIAKGEFPLTGKYEWYTRGSRLEFLIWTTELRQSFRGKVVIHDQF